MFRRLRLIALSRFCERILGEIAAISSDASQPFPERYQSVYRLLQERDREVARAFDDPRRSQAIMQLGLICRLGLLEPEEIAGFSPGIQAALAFLRDTPAR
jgi:hypothetical protein